MLNNLIDDKKSFLKWQRRYKMIVELGRREGVTGRIKEREIVIEFPYTCVFDVANNVDAEVPQATFQIYNLSEEIQAALFKDESNTSVYRRVAFYAGYQGYMPLISVSEATSIYSYREGGSTNYITEFNCNDITAFFQEDMSSMTVVPNTELKNLLQVLLKDIDYLDVGHVSPDIPPLKRPRTFVGQILDLLKREYGGKNIFIDKGKLNVINPNEVIESDVSIISADTGLLGTPRRAQQYLECKMVFEPRLKIAQAIELISSSLDWFNNTYRVLGLRHSGIISPVECGQVVTTVTLSLGESLYKRLQELGQSYGKEATKGKWIKPVQGGYLSSPFGKRTRPTPGASANHMGIDIAVKKGTNVVAPYDGVVTFEGSYGKAGYAIIIDHGYIDGKRVTSQYYHLSQFAIGNNSSVAQGQLIALSGGVPGDVGAGESNGAHLHFAIQEDNNYVNPITYIGGF